MCRGRCQRKIQFGRIERLWKTTVLRNPLARVGTRVSLLRAKIEKEIGSTVERHPCHGVPGVDLGRARVLRFSLARA